MNGEAFGALLNTIDRAAYPCPRGHRDEQMRVFEHAVRWACGAREYLPPRTSFIEHRSTQPTGPTGRADCPVCGRNVALRNDKKVRGHRTDGRRGGPCPGSGQRPRQAAA